MSEMEAGPFARILDRTVASARVIRGAPEAIALTALVAAGISYFGFLQFHRERVAVLNETIAFQERLLTDYRTKLKGATPDEAASQIEMLTRQLTEARKSLSETKAKPVSEQTQSRDLRRLYEDNNPIALTQDPKIDLERKKITFPLVSAAVILGINKVYEFQGWKLACGGTQLYNAASNGVGHGYSYSLLTCKILGKSLNGNTLLT
jgi:hypothetical protein